MRVEIVRLTVAQFAIAQHGFDQVTEAAWSRSADVANRQLDRLEAFAAEVRSRGTFTEEDLARAVSFANEGRAMYENERMPSLQALGATEAQRALGATDHCPDCVAWAALG